MDFQPIGITPLSDQLIDERFQLTPEVRTGGMSVVYRATDLRWNRDCAVKFPRNDRDPKDTALAFQRELGALRSLDHPNIVHLVGEGMLDSSRPYLVLEWLPTDLTEFLAKSNPMSWVAFYEHIGRPILDALRHAHTRRYAHRDLKPQNILFSDCGIPKITDFGISRAIDTPQLGNTFNQAGSPPYTPPEPDDGWQSEQRDVYSWAAIAVSCLTGKAFHDISGLHGALRSIGDAEAPKKALEAALSLDIKDRQQNATVLLADTDGFHQACLDRNVPPIMVHIKWVETAERDARNLFPNLDDDSIKRYLEGDLASVCGANLDDSCRPPRIEFVGATARVMCTLERVRQDRFIVESVSLQSASRAQEIREDLTQLKNVSFSFRPPGFDIDPFKLANTLLVRLRVSDDERARKREEKRRFRWFDCWSSFLREKERFYKARQIRLKTSRIERDGERYIATVENDFNPEEIGESLVIQQNSRRPLIFAVEDIYVDQIVLTLLSGAPNLVPTANAYLETNFEAERQAIARQRNALEEIRRDRAVSPVLKAILCDPSCAASPEQSGFALPPSLSVDKHEILDAALGVQSVLAVKGPPGTGKTTLIAELIVTYLQRYPERRILLSSQTHVALDHVIIKLKAKGLTDKIVRVVSTFSLNSKKIDGDVRDLTLNRKTRKWCEAVEERAKSFLANYATSSSVDATELKVFVVGESLLGARKRLGMSKVALHELNDTEAKIDADRKAAIDNGNIPDSDQIISETSYVVDRRELLKQEISSEEQRIFRLEKQLKSFGDFGKEIVDSDVAAAEDWLSALDATSEQAGFVKTLTKLQLEWVDRLGNERSFQSAVLSEASVVAGTCVGLASTSAIYQDEYDLCIIDEASKATATEALVPIARSRTVVLVGDPEQLPPFFEDRSLYELDGYTTEETQTTLLSLMLSELPQSNKKQLREQRRMVFTIGEMISEIFYDGELENVRGDEKRSKIVKTAFPKPITWISTSQMKAKERQHPGKTFSNTKEVEIVVGALKRLVLAKGKAKDNVSVAVIAAYSAQVRALREAIDQAGQVFGSLNIEVNTVDAFQGKEADVCFYSVTRNNDTGILGFQREKRRLNVALSRARDALVIVGNDLFCRSVKRENPFIPVLDYISGNPDFCEILLA